MADTELAKALKDLHIRIQTASRKERKTTIDDVVDVLSNEGITENIVRGICKVLQLTLPRYRDSTSQAYVKQLIAELTVKHTDWTVKHLTATLSDVANFYKTLSPTASTSQTGLFALGWSCLLVQHGFKNSSDNTKAEFRRLIEVQAMLLNIVVAARRPKKSHKAYHLLSTTWKSVKECEELYVNAITNLDPGAHVLVLGSCLIQYLTCIKKTDLFNKFKAHLLDIFIKVAISCKTKPSLFLIEESRPLLRHVTHEEFKQTLLPAMQKAMLRNPEVILECIGYVLVGLSIDLSQYAKDIGKNLAANLHSKDDLARDEAAAACRNLALQCSDPGALEDLLQHLFNVFHGSEGKLTVATHKMSVLQGAGNLSYNAVTGSSVHLLASQAADHFIKVLDVEVHEKTLIHALDMFSLWCSKFSNEVPQKVIDWLKKGPGLKTSTAPVRTAYIGCMSACFSGNTLMQGLDFIPFLLKTVEKAVSQSAQIPVVTEALSATCMLLKMASADVALEKKLGNLWNIVLDMDKQLFVSDKFLTIASDDALCHVMQLCERLLLDHPHKLNGKANPLHKAIIFCMTSPASKVRQHCHASVKKLVSVLGGTQLAVSLLREFTKFLDSPRIQREAVKEIEGSDTSGMDMSPKVLVNCITTFCAGANLVPEDAQLLAFECLICCHHRSVFPHSPELWLKILKYLKQDPKEFILLNKNKLRRLLIQDYTASPSLENCLRTVTRLSPAEMVPSVIEFSSEYLNSSDILHVTKDEYFTYLTPEGELYDKSVIAGKDADDDLNIKNMKRESKAYSYKEQLEELQLRRELEEKKRREGKLKEPELTPKQKEILRLQLEKESAIRARLTELNSNLIRVVSMIRATMEGNQTELSLYFRDLIPMILRNFPSPLAAPYLTKLFLDIRKCVFSGDLNHLGQLVGHVVLRLQSPQCDLDPAWEEEALLAAVTRTISILHRLTVNPKRKITGSDPPKVLLPAPSFCYCFPLLRSALLSSTIKLDEGVILSTLQIISEHAQMRGQRTARTVIGDSDLYHPRLLPRKQMFELLIDMISRTSGRVQQQAGAALLDVATSGSARDGCARASSEEIDSLLSALQNPSEVVRDAALRALAAMVQALPSFKEDYDQALRLIKRIWVARFDVCPENRALADKLWDISQMRFPTALYEELLTDIIHPVEEIQRAAAEALAALLREEMGLVEPVLEKLLAIYHEKLAILPPKLDSFGRVIEQPVDTWEPRSGVALALAQIAPLLKPTSVSSLITFFVSTGLGDRSPEVRKNMLAAALAAVDLHGKETVNSLLPVFEDFLDKAPDSGSFDAVRQSVVILMGSLARHLEKDDRKVKPIVGKLIDALSTPSQQVQEAVANCLPPLVPAVKDDAPLLVQKLLHQLLESENYGERKGAAYGLAGLVKGMGILALKQLDIMNTLTTAIQNKKNFRHREGALFAFEMLCQMLGRLFEPYIVHVLPHLLLCFGDGSQYVRDATDDTARVVMSKLSAHGVKLVLPSLLAALEEDSWRTKTGSVELLGAMAYCAPKQLSSCLPSIVPKLIEVLSDSHVKVQKAGAQALKLIGSVIRNPEIQTIVPVLLEALQDPSNKTATCLQTLLDTQFVHFIDAPSLALIMPVVQRAFMDRSTETRKMAAQIIGNMYSLTDQKDLTPYLPTIIPGLKTSLLDPVPEVRSVSARALGAMVRGMGESSFEDLLPWLMQTLTSESSSVDRSGAAQGLSEVVGGLGVEKLHKLMPEIISTAERTDIAPHVKDGYIMMFIYMPVVFTNEFTPYIGQIINPILKALADENEYVRDTALKAGQRIVNLYADTAIMLLLPELEKGLFDDNWRIRYSSVQLLGDLLYRISGVSGKMSTETADEDDNFGTEQSHQAIIEALGGGRRNRVLAGLYMGRSDVALMVRQAALHVWKVVVTNTPRTLREILPTLFSLLLGCLASTSYDKRQVAARTLGDLVRKLGERVLPEIIPILEKGLESDQPDQRQGVCIGLSEIMASTSRDMVLTFVNSLVPTVRKALCDPLPEVRQAAAKTFDSLHSTVGVRALDDILPAMLNQLNSPDPKIAESTLDGLRQVMAIKSRVVLPYLVPQLIAPPRVNTKALSILASVAGEALTKYLNKILPALLSALSAAQGTPQEAQELEYCQAVVLSVTDEVGIRTIMDQLMESTRSDKVEVRRSSVTLLCAFCRHTHADYSQYVPQLLRGLIHLFTDSNKEVLQMAWEALNAVTKTLDPTQQTAHVGDIRQAVRFAVSDLKGQELLPGFCLPKGITPILPIFREAILNGLPEVKEQAAQGLGEVIRLTSAEALQPSVVHITGPLIRILGDRFNWNVKAAVLETLALLLAKVGVMLKQFLPQLQTTFLKALNDSNRQVRIKAANALSHLIVIHTRADPLFTELHAGVRSSDDPAIRETMLQALRGVITPAGDKMTEPLRKAVYVTLTGMLGHSEDVTRAAVAGCLGALCRWLSPEQLHATLTDHLLYDDVPMDWTLRHGRSAALSVALKEAAPVVYTDDYKEKICRVLLGYLMADRVPIAMNGVRGCGYLFQHLMSTGQQLPQQLLVPFVRTMNHSSNEVKQLLAKVCSSLAKNVPPQQMAPEFLKLIIPMLVNGTKEKNSYVKANSEFALVSVLRLRHGDEMQQRCLNLLDVGARESLSDVISKVLRKVANQPEGKEEDLDDTLIT
ncbi:eIF-2-alpha kinase activator GCN1 [Schistocerca serialis cubense]|uniref:eIF-2-alpha kinase activator GCN1 n=1 Tax=Schistocerca serialis cubense TaxID=2023355 RepID=UPI00214F1C66|nr:eIF-2-alpha kinase activator GCN1 [Schistocerca serialis cubense]